MSTLSAARLREHEAAMERSLSELGWHLRAIRDERLYRETHETFETYCRERWNYSKTQVNRQIAAAETIDALPLTPNGVMPTEGQVRPLSLLPKEQRAEAWTDAVEASGSESPTARDVAAVVATRRPPMRDHPAPFSDPILERISSYVRAGDVVLDPFAGTGRVHELVARAGASRTIGVEIEPEWAARHVDTINGNALDLVELVADQTVDTIATSPAYGNRMADHHEASDDSVRLTYKHSIGHDLADDNSGAMQWGDEYRAFHLRAWSQAVAVLRPGGAFVLNVKNHVRDGVEQRVVEWHIEALHDLGLRITAIDVVGTRGVMAGANASTRTSCEFVIAFTKGART